MPFRKHAAIVASPAFAFQAMTAFAFDFGPDAVALARNTPADRHTARPSIMVFKFIASSLLRI